MVYCHCTLSLYPVTVHCPCTRSMLSLSNVGGHGTLNCGTVRCLHILQTATAHGHYTLSLYILTIHCTLYIVHCTLYYVHCIPRGFIECVLTHSASATTAKTLH